MGVDQEAPDLRKIKAQAFDAYATMPKKKQRHAKHVSDVSYAIKPSSNAVFRRVQAFEFCSLILLPLALSSLIWLFYLLPDTARIMTGHLLVRH